MKKEQEQWWGIGTYAPCDGILWLIFEFPRLGCQQPASDKRDLHHTEM